MNPSEYMKNNGSTGNLRTREIGPADLVGRIEPHGDKNEPDKICVGGNPRRAPVLSEQTTKPWRPAELASALGAAPTEHRVTETWAETTILSSVCCTPAAAKHALTCFCSRKIGRPVVDSYACSDGETDRTGTARADENGNENYKMS
jgi:hypothetical protein